MKDRIYRLKEMLENIDSGDFHYDFSYSYHSGILEEMIVKSQVEVCHKIASYIEEIIDEEKKEYS
jgi:hypothetical protein